MKLLSAWKMRQMPFGKMVNGLWKTVLFMILVKMELAAHPLPGGFLCFWGFFAFREQKSAGALFQCVSSGLVSSFWNLRAAVFSGRWWS